MGKPPRSSALTTVVTSELYIPLRTYELDFSTFREDQAA